MALTGATAGEDPGSCRACLSAWMPVLLPRRMGLVLFNQPDASGSGHLLIEQRLPNWAGAELRKKVVASCFRNFIRLMIQLDA